MPFIAFLPIDAILVISTEFLGIFLAFNHPLSLRYRSESNSTFLLISVGVIHI